MTGERLSRVLCQLPRYVNLTQDEEEVVEELWQAFVTTLNRNIF